MHYGITFAANDGDDDDANQKKVGKFALLCFCAVSSSAAIGISFAFQAKPSAINNAELVSKFSPTKNPLFPVCIRKICDFISAA